MNRATSAMTIVGLLAVLALAGCGDNGEGGEEPAGGDPDAAIVIESPEAGAEVSSPVTIAGTASVFEGTVQLRIRDAEGREVGRDFATATAGAPERGDFSMEVEFEVDEPQEGTVEAFAEDVASEGEGTASSDSMGVTVPVQLEP